MPCFYDGPPSPASSSNRAVNDELDSLTRMLCNAAKILRYQDVKIQCPGVTKVEMKELQEWIKKHDECDKKRQLEETKKNALAKLSDEEKKALGL